MAPRLETSYTITYSAGYLIVTYADTYPSVSFAAETIQLNALNSTYFTIGDHGYDDINLAFSKCTSPSTSGMTALLDAIVALIPSPTLSASSQTFTGTNIFSTAIQNTTTKAVATPTAGTGIAPVTVGVITAPGTQTTTSASAVNLFAGATGVPALTTVNSVVGFPLPANSLRTGRVGRLKLFGSYQTSGSTATTTIEIFLNTSVPSTIKIGTGVASGTFASAAASLGWSLDVCFYMLDSSHIVVGGGIVLDGANPATTVSGSPSVLSAAAGIDIGAATPSAAATNISVLWTCSASDANNKFQLLAGYLEFLN